MTENTIWKGLHSELREKQRTSQSDNRYLNKKQIHLYRMKEEVKFSY